MRARKVEGVLVEGEGAGEEVAEEGRDVVTLLVGLEAEDASAALGGVAVAAAVTLPAELRLE